jgi:hypothetical protein
MRAKGTKPSAGTVHAVSYLHTWEVYVLTSVSKEKTEVLSYKEVLLFIQF